MREPILISDDSDIVVSQVQKKTEDIPTSPDSAVKSSVHELNAPNIPSSPVISRQNDDLNDFDDFLDSEDGPKENLGPSGGRNGPGRGGFLSSIEIQSSSQQSARKNTNYDNNNSDSIVILDSSSAVKEAFARPTRFEKVREVGEVGVEKIADEFEDSFDYDDFDNYIAGVKPPEKPLQISSSPTRSVRGTTGPLQTNQPISSSPLRRPPSRNNMPQIAQPLSSSSPQQRGRKSQQSRRRRQDTSNTRRNQLISSTSPSPPQVEPEPEPKSSSPLRKRHATNSEISPQKAYPHKLKRKTDENTNETYDITNDILSSETPMVQPEIPSVAPVAKVLEIESRTDTKKGPQLATKKASVKATERERKRREKEAERALAQEEKLRRKALEEANRVKRNKADSAKEIIVDIYEKLYEHDIGHDVVTKLREIGMEVKKWEKKPIQQGNWSPIRLRRKVTSKYDADEDIYRPCELEVVKEDKAFVFVNGNEFVKTVTEDELDKHISDIRGIFPTENIVYIIQGLEPIIRKAENAKNRAYTERVRQLMDGDNRKQPKKATKSSSLTTTVTEGIERSKAEELIVRLQIGVGFKVILTHNVPETVDWITSMAQACGQAPYKTAKLLGNEVVDVGVIRSGKDTYDTHLKALQQIKYVTPPVARNIATIYPNTNSLLNKIADIGVDALSGIQVSGANGRKKSVVGKSLANSIHAIFTSKDPDEYLESQDT